VAFEIIEKDLNGKGSIRAFVIDGSSDLMALSFYKNICPEISHLDVFNNNLLKMCVETILDCEYEQMLFLDKIEVKEEYRGQGIAKQAIADVFEEYSVEFSLLIASPIDEGESGLDADALVSFYESLGYSKTHELDLDMGYLMCFV
jgi:GNAT superfamily N-acetyltransferase